MQNPSRLMKLDSVKGTRRFSVGVHGFALSFIGWCLVLDSKGQKKCTEYLKYVWVVQSVLLSIKS